MATQTIEFRAAPGLTITARLYAVGSDTEVANASATEQTNRKGTYLAAFTDIPAGEYQLIGFVSSTPVASWLVTLTLTTATFQVYDRSTPAIDAIDARIPANPVDVSDLLAPVSFGQSPQIVLADTGNRRITWPTPNETITGTIQWQGQSAKAITGAINFVETIDGIHFYEWAYNAADRPTEPSWGIIILTDGTYTDNPLIVRFVNVPTASQNAAATRTELTPELTKVDAIDSRPPADPAAVSDITDARDEVLAADRLFDLTVYSANTGFVTIDSLANELGTVGRLENCLMRITDSSGRIQERWIRSHFHSSGRAGFNPDLDFNPTPQVGDQIEIFAGTRGAANVVNWRGTVPNTLVNNRVDASVGNMANNTVSAAAIANNAITGDKLAATAITKIQDGIITTAQVTAIVGEATGSLPTSEEVAEAVWDADIEQHTTENTFGWLFTSVGAGVATLLGRVTGLLRTKAEADADQAKLLSDIGQSLGPDERRVTFVVTFNDNQPVPGVRITVDGTLRRGFTQANGVLTLNLPESATEYNVKLAVPAGFDPLDDIAIAVGGTDVTVPVSAVVADILPPVSPDLIPTLINVRNQLGNPCQGAKVVVEVIGTPAFADDAVLTNVDNTAFTSVNGQARLDLLRGQRYQFTITYKRYPPITLTRQTPTAGINFIVTQVVG